MQTNELVEVVNNEIVEIVSTIETAYGTIGAILPNTAQRVHAYILMDGDGEELSEEETLTDEEKGIVENAIVSIITILCRYVADKMLIHSNFGATITKRERSLTFSVGVDDNDKVVNKVCEFMNKIRGVKAERGTSENSEYAAISIQYYY